MKFGKGMDRIVCGVGIGEAGSERKKDVNKRSRLVKLEAIVTGNLG